MSRRGATRVMGTVLEGAVRAAVSCKEENGDPRGSRLSWLFPEPSVREAGPGTAFWGWDRNSRVGTQNRKDIFILFRLRHWVTHQDAMGNWLRG